MIARWKAIALFEFAICLYIFLSHPFEITYFVAFPLLAGIIVIGGLEPNRAAICRLLKVRKDYGATLFLQIGFVAAALVFNYFLVFYTQFRKTWQTTGFVMADILIVSAYILYSRKDNTVLGLKEKPPMIMSLFMTYAIFAILVLVFLYVRFLPKPVFF